MLLMKVLVLSLRVVLVSIRVQLDGTRLAAAL